MNNYFLKSLHKNWYLDKIVMCVTPKCTLLPYFYYCTREFDVALVNISKGKKFARNGNTFIHSEIDAITFTMQTSFTFASVTRREMHE